MDKELMKRLEKLMKKSTVKDNYSCPKCRDLGYTFETDEHNNEVAVPCQCLSKKRALENLQKCGLSEIFKEKTFLNYNCSSQSQINAKFKALQYCSTGFQEKKSLILSGQSGSGKTHLGIAVMLNLIEKGANCRYVEYNNMMISLKQSVMDEINHLKEMEKVLNPPVLFLDDFLKGNTSSADLNHIYRIVNSRYLMNKPMIISTEKTMEEILSWDEAVGSRLVEMAGENIIYFDKNTRNYRLKEYL